MSGCKNTLPDLISSAVNAVAEIQDNAEKLFNSEIMYKKEDGSKEPVLWLVGTLTKLHGLNLGMGSGLMKSNPEETSLQAFKLYTCVAIAVLTADKTNPVYKFAKEIMSEDVLHVAELIQNAAIGKDPLENKEDAVNVLMDTLTKLKLMS